jgi:hypothetical protein
VEPFFAVMIMRERLDMVSALSRFLARSMIEAASWAFTERVNAINAVTKNAILFILKLLNKNYSA